MSREIRLLSDLPEGTVIAMQPGSQIPDGWVEVEVPFFEVVTEESERVVVKTSDEARDQARETIDRWAGADPVLVVREGHEISPVARFKAPTEKHE